MPPAPLVRVSCPYCRKGAFEPTRGLTGHINQTPACREKRNQALARHRSSSPASSPIQQPSSPVSPINSPVFQPDLRLSDWNSDSDDARSDTPNDDETPNEFTTPLNAKGDWTFQDRDPLREPAIYGYRGTKWDQRKAGEDPDFPYYPFANEREWRTVQWLASEGLSQGSINRYIAMQKENGTVFSFSSAKEMYDRIQNHMGDGPKWKVKSVEMPEADGMSFPLFYRDPVECAIHLFGTPDYEEVLDYAPDVIFNDPNGRVYHEISSGDLWNELQADPRIPPGTTVITIMFASDKTHLTVYSGDQNMHPVYISIGNLQKDARNKPSRRGWMLLAKLPTHKFSAFKARLDARKTEKDAMPGVLAKRLFHRAMSVVLEPLKEMKVVEAVDASGNVRKVVVVLVAWLADLEEQLMILGLAKNSCPKCVARYDEFGLPHAQARRTGQSILDALREIRAEYQSADVWQFVGRAVPRGYVGVEELCWDGLPLDMCRVICVDALHGLHKMFGDHILRWVTNAVGEDELDLRFMAQLRRVGFRNFHSGISHLSQLSGREHRDIERHILPVIAGVEGLHPDVVKCVAAILDFINTALIPLHTDESLQRLKSHLDTFWKTVNIFIAIKARVGESGDVIKHFNIPKLHNLHHFIENIRDLGAPGNYSTEISESLHIPFCKEAYEATNRREYDSQIIAYLIRMEALAEYSAYRAWRDEDEASPVRDVDAQTVDHDPDLDDNDGEDVPSGASSSLRIAMRPHLRSKTIDSIMQTFEIPDLHSAITLYHRDHDSGAQPHRDDYSRDHLPPLFSHLNAWTLLRFTRPPLNEFYSAEQVILRCKPSTTGGRITFTPIIVELPPTRNRGTPERRVADLRLIFQSDELNNTRPLAYVHWYKRTGPARGPHKLREVQKMTRGQSRAGGVITLDQILGPCPLGSKIDGLCPAGLDQNNAPSRLSSFWINPFGTHAEYEDLR